MLIAAILCVVMSGIACHREDAPETITPDYTRMELSFDMGALKTRAAVSGEQGDKIQDVTVWAYPKFGDVVTDTPVGWATKHFDGDYADAPIYMELPYDSLNTREYRIVAVLNQDAWGTIAIEPRPGAPLQVLDEKITYSSLIHTIFRADGDMMTNITDATELMPVSHWKDFTVPVKATEITGEDAKMTVYRALAKTTFNARLASSSSPDAALRITNVEVLTGKGISVPTLGYMFSSINEEALSGITEANPMPQAFGSYSSLTYYMPEITMPLTAAQVPIIAKQAIPDTAPTYTDVGSVFLYENHQGMAYDGSVSTTDPSGYTGGAYYLMIEYEYGLDNNEDMTPDENIKSGVNYVPLPSIVRNRDYQINATFDVQLAGAVKLNYTVKPWVTTEDDGETQLETDLNFTYPTFSIEAIATYDHDNNPLTAELPYYGKPTAYYNGNDLEEGAFQFKLQITAPIQNPAKKFTLTHPGSGFDAKIYRVHKEGSIINATKIADNEIESHAEDYYIIKIYPTAPYNSSDPATCVVGITHHASWTGTIEALLINTTMGGPRWADSGTDRHSIIVTQVEGGGSQ